MHAPKVRRLTQDWSRGERIGEGPGNDLRERPFQRRPPGRRKHARGKAEIDGCRLIVMRRPDGTSGLPGDASGEQRKLQGVVRNERAKERDGGGRRGVLEAGNGG